MVSSNDVLMLAGSKGGGGSYRNTPDNLRSTDTFETILGIAGVRTKLAPGGLKNLYIDDVPVEDSQGKASFQNFSAILFEGDPTQLAPISLKLGQSSGATAVQLGLTNTYTSGPGDWRNAAITTPGADFIDLRFIVQALYKQTKKGVFNNTASIEVQLRPSGSATWVNPFVDKTIDGNVDPVEGKVQTTFGFIVYVLKDAIDTLTNTWRSNGSDYLKITGKTSSAYVKELRIALPTTGTYANKTWEVRCRLVERDYVVSGTNGENEERRTIQWESVAAVKSGAFGGTEGWRGISWLQVNGKATDQISGIPTIKGIYDLGTQLVPGASVWNPVTRVYTGAAWDGVTYVNAWTQCPAWQIRGLIEDDLSGVSALAPGSTLNKWDALEASKWFAELVPDGKGGTHPRYTLNWFLEQPMQVKALVNYLGGAVGAFCWDEGNGRWRMKVEKPENPVMIFTRENITGEFIYSHTDLDTRFNDFTGVFRNEENRYKEDRVRVFDQPDIDATGRRHTSIALVGCTNRQEALRRLQIRLLTSLNETRQITFTTNRQGLLLEPLSVIAVADSDLNSSQAIRSTGRIVAVSADRLKITVRDAIRLEVGVAYTVSITIPNDEYDPETTTQPANGEWRKPTKTVTINVTNTAGQRGDVYDIYLQTALPASTPEFAPIALSAPGLPALPKQYRVVNVLPDEKNETVAIRAVEIYTSKWVESDSITEDQINSQLVNRVVPPPVAPAVGVFQMQTYTTEFENKRVLTVNWERPATIFLDDFRVEYSYNDGPFQNLGNTRDTFLEIPEPREGTYQVRIYTRDRRGAESLPLIATTDLDETLSLAPVVTLTNAAVTVPADVNGNVSSFANAGGSMEVRTQAGLQTTGVTYSVVSTTGGLSISINAAGLYTTTALTSDFGSAILRAVYQGHTLDQTYTIAKARAGAAGTNGPAGLNNASVFIYKRSATVPALPTTTTTYTFATGGLTGLDNGWTAGVPAGSNPLYVAVAAASAVGATDTIAANEWSAPVILAQDGAPGSTGLNSATVTLYKRSASTPTLPSVSSTYTFATGVLTGQNNGWTQTVPASNGQALYVTTASAANTTATDTIAAAEWASPQVLVQDGAAGSTGNTIIRVFRRNTTLPATPTGDGTPVGWSRTIPAGTVRLWSSEAEQTATGVLVGTWSDPSPFGEIGFDDIELGDNGAGRARFRLRDRHDVWVRDIEFPSAAQNADQQWSQVSGAGRPADNATANIALKNVYGSAVSVLGNSLVKTGGGYAWDSLVASDFLSGNVKASAVIAVANPTVQTMFGLGDGVSTDPLAYKRVNYGIFLSTENDYDIYESGLYLGYVAGVTPAAGDVIEIEYLQDSVKYWINGALVRTSTGIAPNQRLRAEVALVQVQSTAPITNISLTPTSDDAKVHGVAAGASNDIALWEPLGSGLTVITGNTVTKKSTSGSSWNSQVASRLMAGSVKASALVNATTGTGSLGLGDGLSSSSSSYIRSNFQIFVNGATSYDIYESSQFVGTVAGVTPAPGHFIEIEYLQDSVKYWINGQLKRTTTGVAPNRVFRAEINILSAGFTPFTNISLTPTADDAKLYGVEVAADVTKMITGTASLTVEFDSSGNVTTALPLTSVYRLTTTSGVNLTSGCTWSVVTESGSWVGTVPSISGTGSGQLSINSAPATSTVTLKITGTYASRSYTFSVVISKYIAPASNTGSSSSSFASDTTLTSVNSSTFTAVTEELIVTTGAGKTSVALTAAQITLNALGLTQGATSLEGKWQWWNGSSWVDVAAAVAAWPIPEVYTDGEGLPIKDPGSITVNQTKTGLTQNTQYKFRLMGRITSGVIRTISWSGTASAQG